MRFTNIMSFTGLVKEAVKVKRQLAKDMFLTFGNNIPIVYQCEIEPNGIASLQLWNDEEIRVKLLISENGYPKQVKEIISKSVCDKYCVILAPFISEQTAKICKEANVGFLDMAGNCYIAYKSLFIQIHGNKNSTSPKRSLKSIYERTSVVSSIILRKLLEDANRKWKLKDLAREAGCSIGQVSKVKDFLLKQAYLDQCKDGISVIDPRSVMKDWAKVYASRADERVHCYSLASIPDLEARISRMNSELGTDCLLTGFSGGVRYQPVVRYQKIHALIGPQNLEKAIEYLGLKKVDSGANVTFIIRYDDCVTHNSRTIKNDKVASPVQVYLDCMSLKGRGEEMAEAILNNEICK